MSELPEKQVKRLKALLNEAETNLAAARELLTSLVGDDPAIDFSHRWSKYARTRWQNIPGASKLRQ